MFSVLQVATENAPVCALCASHFVRYQFMNRLVPSAYPVEQILLTVDRLISVVYHQKFTINLERPIRYLTLGKA